MIVNLIQFLGILMSESPIDYLRRTPEERAELYEKESVAVVASG